MSPEEMTFDEVLPIHLDYHALNAQVNLVGEDGKLQLDKDAEATRQFFLQKVNQNMVWFHNLEEKIDYCVENDYWDEETIENYTQTFVKSLFKLAYSYRFRFKSFMGAFKFYSQYAMKTFDGSRFIERYEDRVVMTALYLAQGDEELARRFVTEMMEGRYQPATPTFLNAGKGVAKGDLISCYLLRVEDNMESIAKAVHSSLQLSKRGGGVGLNLTNIRESGAPIKKIMNQSSGIVPVMKILEDSFSYANQLGARQGAGAVYLNVHHPDILAFLDTKRENADEKIRIKTLSLGLVVPDITFELAKRNADMYLFSPYDVEREYGVPMSDISITEKYSEMVENPNIRKKRISARKLFQTIAEIQFESGYPYMVFEDTVNRNNPIDGRISMSNLCLTGDTRLLTSNGYKRFDELWETQEDLEVLSDNRAVTFDVRNDTISVNSSTKVVRTAENAETFKVHTVEGFEVKASAWHKFFVERSNEIVKVPLTELHVGDSILIQPGEGSFGNVNEPSQAYSEGISANNTVPDFVLDGNYATQVKFLSGLFESGAEIVGDTQIGLVGIEYASDSYSFLQSIQKLLINFGVFSSIYSEGALYLRTTTLTDSRKLYDLLEWSDSQKGTWGDIIGVATIEEDGNSFHNYKATIDSIQFHSVEDVYDVTVENGHSIIVDGVTTSNCSEILQVSTPSTYYADGNYDSVGRDISCNLGSLNIAKAFDGPDFSETVEVAMRALTAVSNLSKIESVPSIQRGNELSHAVGLGAMNLHGFLAREHIYYDSEEALDFTNLFFLAMNYETLRASNKIAKELGETFYEFEKSQYASGEYFDKYIDKDWSVPRTEKVRELFERTSIKLPSVADWKKLRRDVKKYGLYHAYRQAIPPTGSISYISDSTASIHPINKPIETRKEGKVGRVYYPAPYLSEDTLPYYHSAFKIGPEPLIDVYAAATEHVDQGLSLTMFFPDTATSRDLNKAYIYAWRKGIKTIYYIRLNLKSVAGTELDGQANDYCEACQL